MLSSASGNGLGVRSAREAGGVAGGVCVVHDVDAHHERARAGGAEVVRAPADTTCGSREYMDRDLEGHLWSFGTYLPE